MTRIVLFLAVSLMFGTALVAQSSERILIKAGEDVKASLAHQVYSFPKFETGIVALRDGSASRGLLNYHLLNEEMQFISPLGDTLALANEQTIKFVTVGIDSFFYDHGYLHMIAANSTVKLAVKQRLKIVDKQRIGAYNQPSSTGSIQSQNSYISGSRSYPLNVLEDILLAKETSFYLSDKYNHFVSANRKNLIKLFYRNQKEIENFLKDAHTDFDKLEDLVTLIGFVNKIEAGN